MQLKENQISLTLSDNPSSEGLGPPCNHGDHTLDQVNSPVVRGSIEEVTWKKNSVQPPGGKVVLGYSFQKNGTLNLTTTDNWIVPASMGTWKRMQGSRNERTQSN